MHPFLLRDRSPVVFRQLRRGASVPLDPSSAYGETFANKILVKCP
jgi:hypothetical protein